MARCDEGYLCEVCGDEVEGIHDSDLYLRYVIGEMDPERLHTTGERHLRCNPTLAQFIEHDDFDRITCEGSFDKRTLDPIYVRQRNALVTQGYTRLQSIAAGELGTDLTAYPLNAAGQKYRQR